MNDPSGRSVDTLRLSLTDRCNLRCVYCMAPGGVALVSHRDILRYEEILKIVGAMAQRGVRRVRVTGGEPLLRRGVLPFIERLAKLAGIEEVLLTTNGWHLEEYAPMLHDAGVSRVNVSLDTLSEERYRHITGVDGLARVMAGIERALAVGLGPVRVNMVPLPGINDDEVCDFAQLASEGRLGVRFIERMSRRGSEPCEFIPTDRLMATIEARYGVLEPLEDMMGFGPARYYRIPATGGIIGFISSVSKPRCTTCRRLRLTSDGTLLGCLAESEDR